MTFSLSAGTGTTQSIGMDHGQGLLVATASGLAGHVSGHVTTNVGADLSITGTLGLTVNTTAAAVTTSLTVGGVTQTLTVAAGPYLRFEGTGLTVTVLGQTLTGDVAVEKATPLLADGTADTTRSVLRLTATNVTLTLGGATPVVSLTQGTAVLLLTGTTVAGRVTGTLAVAIPQVSLTGDLALEVNTGSTAVNETFRIGSAAPVTLVLPAAGTGGPYVQVRAPGSPSSSSVSGSAATWPSPGPSPAAYRPSPSPPRTSFSRWAGRHRLRWSQPPRSREPAAPSPSRRRG